MSKDKDAEIDRIAKRLERIELGIVLLLKNIEQMKQPIDAQGRPFKYENRGNGGTDSTLH